MMFNYLQNNGNFKYDFKCIENKLAELLYNNVIDDNFKISNPIEKVLNFHPSDNWTLTKWR